MRVVALAAVTTFVASLAVASPLKPHRSIGRADVNAPKYMSHTVSRRQTWADSHGNDLGDVNKNDAKDKDDDKVDDIKKDDDKTDATKNDDDIKKNDSKSDDIEKDDNKSDALDKDGDKSDFTDNGNDGNGSNPDNSNAANVSSGDLGPNFNPGDVGSGDLDPDSFSSGTSNNDGSEDGDQSPQSNNLNNGSNDNNEDGSPDDGSNFNNQGSGNFSLEDSGNPGPDDNDCSDSAANSCSDSGADGTQSPVQANQNWNDAAADPPARTTVGKIVSQDTFNQLKYYANYAAAAYCPPNVSPDVIGKNVSCDRNICQEISGGKQIVAAYTQTTIPWGSAWSNQPYDNSYFVALDGGDIVVTFRGSGIFSDRGSFGKAAGNVVQTTWLEVPTCEKCKVGQTYNDAWNTIKPDITAAVSKNLGKTSRIMIVGHSAGAAIATIAAGELRADALFKDRVIDLYSFASPRIGDPNFATFVTNQTLGSAGNNYRVVHANDHTINLLPYSSSLLVSAYRHVAPEYWIKVGGATNNNKDVLYFEPGYKNGILLEQEEGSWSNYWKGDQVNAGDAHKYYIIPMYDSDSTDYTC